MTLASHRLEAQPAEGGALPALARLAREAESPAVAAAADALARRVEEGRFHVACVGQFKRGKSTLINALLGDPILPAGVRPVTSVVTVVRHGEARSARVFSSAGSFIDVPPAALADYVSETGNPDNRRGVRAVEVFHPAPILASGLCLVDTPGLGSVFEGNSAATRDFVPHIDAVIAVVGADPPISGEELSLLSSIAGQTSHLLIVLNKADRIPEGDRAEAVAFAREVIQQRLGRPPGHIFEVSALKRLRDGTSSENWDGMVEELRTLAAKSGAAMVRAAEERGASLLAGRLLSEIDGKRRALERPLADTAERLGRLRRALGEAARSTRDLGPLLAAEQERFRLRFAEERDRFLAEALPQTEQELLEGMADETTAGSELGRLGAERARQIARRRIAAWQALQQAEAEQLYQALAVRFVALANDLLSELAKSPDLAGSPLELLPEAGIQAASHFMFNDLLNLAEPSFGRSLVAQALPLRAPMIQHASGYLRRLLETNSARVVNDFIERVLQSRRRLEAEIQARLAEVAGAARRALEWATVGRREGAARVEAELARLDSLRAEVERLRAWSGKAASEAAVAARTCR